MTLMRYAPFADLEAFGGTSGLKAFEDKINRMFAEPNGRPCGSRQWTSWRTKTS